MNFASQHKKISVSIFTCILGIIILDSILTGYAVPKYGYHEKNLYFKMLFNMMGVYQGIIVGHFINSLFWTGLFKYTTYTFNIFGGIYLAYITMVTIGNISILI